MNDIYPRKNRYLKFQKAGSSARITDILTEKEWMVSDSDARFIKSLDGKTDPYSLLDDHCRVEEILEFMHDESLFDDGGRVMRAGIGTLLFALWIPNVGLKHRVAGFVYNHLLMMVWLPVLIIGIWGFFSGAYVYKDVELWEILLGVYGGIASGVLVHELSHAAAILNYGGMLCELGVMLFRFFPGGYCIADYQKVKNRFRRAQIKAAGIESNLFLCGFFLCLMRFSILPTGMFLYVAIINACLGMMNLSLINRLDGGEIFEEFIGCREFVPRARLIVFDRVERDKLRKRGINGKATIAACYIICVFQILLPLCVIMEAVQIISVFCIR